MIQGDPDTIHDFLLLADDEFPVELGRLDFEDDKLVDRDIDGVVLNNSKNKELYRDFGLDNVIEAARSFNFGKKRAVQVQWGIVDQEKNLYAETAFRPIAETFYSNLPDTYSPNAAKILIQNSGVADECINQILDPGQDPVDPYIGGLSYPDRRTLTECYLSRVFQAIAVLGLVKTFPVRTDPDGGNPIPIFNILPKNAPNGFRRVLVSTIIPAESAEIFKDIDFTVSNPDPENRFVWKTNPTDSLEDKLQSVFSPRATANEELEEQDITFNFPNTTTRGSTGAVLFEATMNLDTNAPFSDFETSIDAGQGDLQISESIGVEWGRNAYVKTIANDLLVHDFNDDSTFGLGQFESVSFTTFTIDSDEQAFDLQSLPSSFSDPQNLADFFNDKLDSDYVTFEVSGSDNDKVVATGNAYFYDFESPYVTDSTTSGSVTAIINLQLFVPGDQINSLTALGPETFQSTSNEQILRNAPFFDIENNDEWKFVSRELATPPQQLQDIDVKAKQFDPDLGIEDAPDPIVDKAFNIEYQGFGARAMNYESENREEVDEGTSILGDFYRFFKDYVETNYSVMHVGITDTSPPSLAVSPPQQLEIELSR